MIFDITYGYEYGYVYTVKNKNLVSFVKIFAQHKRLDETSFHFSYRHTFFAFSLVSALTIRNPQTPSSGLVVTNWLGTLGNVSENLFLGSNQAL